METKFNIILANPPYVLGQNITNNVISNLDFDQYINLMPKKCYMGGVYKHTTSMQTVPNFFTDALVGKVITLAELSKNESMDAENDYREWETNTFEETLQKFYRKNEERPLTFTPSKYYVKLSNINMSWDDVNQDTAFFTYIRTAHNGVDISGYMYDWNNKIVSKEELRNLILRSYKRTYGEVVYGEFFFFSTPEEKDNFTTWYYSGGRQGLAHRLIIGLNKTSASILPAIPRVDWTRPWTDEEILREFGYTPEEMQQVFSKTIKTHSRPHNRRRTVK